MNVTRQIVDRGLSVTFDDLPAEAVVAAKVFILDTIGVGIAGKNAVYSENVLRAARRWGQPGLSGTAHLMGRQQRLPASSAAFVNGFQIHCQEFDCVHEGAVVHPMATIFASLMAETETQKSLNGQEFLTAIIVAVDLAAGLGVASNAPIKFFRPANAGLFGATQGVARLRQYSAEKTLSSLGFALAHCAGTMQSHIEGKPALPIQIGNAARAAILSCDLAGAGIPGPEDVFEGPFGYFPLFEGDWDVSRLVDQSVGQRITEISHKPFPTGRAAQGGIVAMRQLRDRGVTAENVESITLTAPPLIERLVGRPYLDDMEVNYARLCFAYLGAIALQNNDIKLSDFDDAVLRSATVATLAKKITVLSDGGKNPATFTPQRATAHLISGETIVAEIDALYGSPDDPMSHEQQLEKFDACIEFAKFSAVVAKKLKAKINALEKLPSIREIGAMASGYSE